MLNLIKVLNVCSLVRISLAASLLGIVGACAQQGIPINVYGASGGPTKLVRCPVGEYEVCLLKMGDLCQESGYSILEKMRQVKPGVWSDAPEFLLIGQCNFKSPLRIQGA